MKILVTEQQLSDIEILLEDTPGIKYQCFPEFSEAIEIAIETEKIPPIFVKTALAILGRESNYGKIMGNSISRFLPSKYAVKAAPEYVYNALTKNPKMANFLGNIMKKVKGKENWVPSMGIAQMTPDVAKQYGVDLDELMSKTGSLIAAASYLQDMYAQLTNFDEGVPSQVKLKTGMGPFPYSTRNARLDATIISYNLGSKRLRRNYCVTNDPNYLGPCSTKQYKPFPTSKPDLVLTVDQSRWIKNYLPNFVTGKITSHGYLKEVSQAMKNFNCF